MVLALSAFGVLAYMLVVWWHDRDTDRWPAQAALAVSLALIAGDTLLRVGRHDPFVAHLFAARTAIVVLSGVYAVRRLTRR